MRAVSAEKATVAMLPNFAVLPPEVNSPARVFAGAGVGVTLAAAAA